VRLQTSDKVERALNMAIIATNAEASERDGDRDNRSTRQTIFAIRGDHGNLQGPNNWTPRVMKKGNSKRAYIGLTVFSPPPASIPEVKEHGKGLAPSGLIVGLLQEGARHQILPEMGVGLLQEGTRRQDGRTMTIVMRAATLMSIQCCNCGLYGYFRRECRRRREGCPGSDRKTN
jgi:hypothetical protein